VKADPKWGRAVTSFLFSTTGLNLLCWVGRGRGKREREKRKKGEKKR
jgi:hypothetical protein